MGVPSSLEHPLPVRTVSRLIGQWIGRLGVVWMEGQLTQLVRRPGTRTVFLTLRDPAADISLSVTCPAEVFEALPVAVSEGAQLVVRARPTFYLTRGTLSMTADEIRPVGVGELLARVEHLRRLLAAEGLFGADRKQRLPFLPAVVGLVCGRASAAERDVVDNARRRWPAVRFRIEEVAVQGPNAVTAVMDALAALDADPTVEVIVVTRGGGSVEDLLPFSNEALVRAVAACRTPVVSAIGHETDSPILDLVADLRASTPTDAAKRVVPDVAEETTRILLLRDRAERAVSDRIAREGSALTAVRSRTVLAAPLHAVAERSADTHRLLERARRCFDARLHRAADDLAHTRARVAALSPAATLARGYAVVQRTDGTVVRRDVDAADGDRLRVRLGVGELAVQVTGRAR